MSTIQLDHRSLRAQPATIVFFFSIGLLAAWMGLKGGIENPRTAGQSVLFAVVAMICASCSCLVLVSSTGRVWSALKYFELGPWWIVKFTVIFGVSAIVWVHPQTGSSGIVQQAGVPLAILVAAGGMIAWTIGYVIGPPSVLGNRLQRLERWALPQRGWKLRFPSLPLLLYLFGTAVLFLQLITNRFGYLGDPVNSVSSPSALNELLAQLGLFTRYGLILAALDAATSRSIRSQIIFRALLVGELTFALLGGVKEAFLLNFLVVLIVYGVARGRISRPVVALAVIGAIIIFPLTQAYRDYVRGGGIGSVSPQQAIAAFPSIASATLTNMHTGEAFTSSLVSVAQRLRLIDNLAVIVQKTPSIIPYQGAKELLIAPIVGVIPRVLWRDKPILSYGYRFSQQYWNVPSFVYTSTAPTIPGDLYRHVGLLGMLIGMALFGALGKAIQQSLHPRRALCRLLVYIPLFILLTNLELDVPSLLASVVPQIIILHLVARNAFWETAE